MRAERAGLFFSISPDTVEDVQDVITAWSGCTERDRDDQRQPYTERGLACGDETPPQKIMSRHTNKHTRSITPHI